MQKIYMITLDFFLKMCYYIVRENEKEGQSVSKQLEKNLNPEYVVQNAHPYHWPFSQPRILNTVKATSHIGFLIGFISSIFINRIEYFSFGIAIFDIFAIISFILLRGFIVPAVRRAQISYVASESRGVNKWILIVACTYMYSAMIRVSISIILTMFYNKGKLDNYFDALSYYIDIKAIIVGALIVLIPTICVLFPRDISVKEFHLQVKQMWDEHRMFEPVTNQPHERVPYMRSPNNMSGRYTGDVAPRQKSPARQAETTKNVQTRQSKPKHISPEPKQEKKSVWDSQKVVRKPRR